MCSRLNGSWERGGGTNGRGKCCPMNPSQERGERQRSNQSRRITPGGDDSRISAQQTQAEVREPRGRRRPGTRSVSLTSRAAPRKGPDPRGWRGAGWAEAWSHFAVGLSSRPVRKTTHQCPRRALPHAVTITPESLTTSQQPRSLHSLT